MELILNFNNTKVYDDVLSASDFTQLFDWYNAIPLVNKVAQGVWNKTWNLSDGNILVGQERNWSSTALPKLEDHDLPVLPFINQATESVLNSGLFDDDTVIDFAMTPFCWPAGTGLSWHNDSNYIGAFTYYCHNHWNPEWGGEFLTVEADQYILDDKTAVKWRVFDNRELHELILNHGHGHFIHPKPNRMIINKGGTRGILHKVARSTVNSGPRLTLQGFIRKHD
jgi:Rps23 Pro-64 3,4-dihydroxylase Tpa1-like proline 4-hydroxylase